MLLILLHLLTGILPFTTSTCYNLTGDVVDGEEFQPCDLGTGKASMCCATNRTSKSGADTRGQLKNDICLDNGLCEYVFLDSNGDEQYQYYRDFCSSQTWDGCLNDVCNSTVCDIIDATVESL